MHCIFQKLMFLEYTVHRCYTQHRLPTFKKLIFKLIYCQTVIFHMSNYDLEGNSLYLYKYSKKSLPSCVEAMSCAQKLFLEDSFNQNLVMTTNITYLEINSCFNKMLNLLPNVRTLLLNSHYTQYLTLPKYLQIIDLGNSYDLPFVLNKYIEHATFGYFFDQIVELSKNILHVYFNRHYKKPLVITKNLRTLVFDDTEYYCPITLGKHITHFEMSYGYGHVIVLPKYLKYLVINYPNAKSFTLNKYIKTVHIDDKKNSDYVLDGLLFGVNIGFNYPNLAICDNLPNNVICIEMDMKISEKQLCCNNLPNKTKCC